MLLSSLAEYYTIQTDGNVSECNHVRVCAHFPREGDSGGCYQNVVVDEKGMHAAGADGAEFVVAFILFSVPYAHLSVH